jgi:hypothetical protein
MRIGFILECSSKGPDADIYPYLAKLFCPKFEIENTDVLTLNNKANVMNEGPAATKILLESGCNFVFIIWDRMPKWGGTGNCEDHRNTIIAGLDSLGIDKSMVILCCIKDMLESWMLGDGNAITEYFQAFAPAHRLSSFPDYKSSVEQSKPEEKLMRYNGRYDKYSDNFKIIKLIKDFGKIANRNESFRFFKESIEEICQVK